MMHTNDDDNEVYSIRHMPSMISGSSPTVNLNLDALFTHSDTIPETLPEISSDQIPPQNESFPPEIWKDIITLIKNLLHSIPEFPRAPFMDISSELEDGVKQKVQLILNEHGIKSSPQATNNNNSVLQELQQLMDKNVSNNVFQELQQLMDKDVNDNVLQELRRLINKYK